MVNKAKRGVVLALMMAVTVMAAPPGLQLPDGATNLVDNGGFEACDADGTTFTGWEHGQYERMTLTQDRTVRHGGTGSLRFAGAGKLESDKYRGMMITQRVELSGPGDVCISLWLKAAGAGYGHFKVVFYDKDMLALEELFFHQVMTPTFDWRPVVDVIRKPAGARYVTLHLGLLETQGTLWIDDVEVYVVPGIDQLLAEQVGRVSFTPQGRWAVGEQGDFELTLTTGAGGMQPGQALIVNAHWSPTRFFRFRDVRVVDAPGEAAFDIELEDEKWGFHWPLTHYPPKCTVRLTEGALPAGTTIRLAGGMSCSDYSNVVCPLEFFLGAGPLEPELKMAGEAVLRNTDGGRFHRLQCVARARPRVGEPARVLLVAFDEFDNPVTDFAGTVELAADGIVGLPATYTFTPADRGRRAFDVLFPAERVSRVTARYGDCVAVSNPVLPRGAGEPGVFFGDIHVHCELSGDGVGDPDLAYDYAAQYNGLDFAALTDHSPFGAAWLRTVAVGNGHNQPGEFVTLLGYEWSDPVHGHRNVYYRGDTGRGHELVMQAGLQVAMTPWWDLLDAEGIQALTIPHHVNTKGGAWNQNDWSVINHEYQRVVEMNQIRGSFELPGGPNPELHIVHPDCGASVQAALAAGHRLGFIGSTDNHYGMPGNNHHGESIHRARCVILSDTLERRALWDQLDQRHCYATTGEHILVFFQLNGRQMGSELATTHPDEPRRVTWRAIGTAAIKRIDLLRNNEVVQSWEGAGRDDLAGAFTRVEPLGGVEWWYLRVLQENDHLAWASPIWIEPFEGPVVPPARQ